MKESNITPEERKKDLLNAIKTKDKNLAFSRHNLMNTIGNLVRKYEGNIKTIIVTKYPSPLQITTEPFTPTKQKDLVFYKTIIQLLDGDTEPILNNDEIPIENVVEILDIIIENNLNKS